MPKEVSGWGRLRADDPALAIDFVYLRFAPVAFGYLRCASVLESCATEHDPRSQTGNYLWQML
jgi:hypothetical protein